MRPTVIVTGAVHSFYSHRFNFPVKYNLLEHIITFMTNRQMDRQISDRQMDMQGMGAKQLS